ncbi:acyl-CoA dehydrogenase family protein [Acaryochloris marina NIES-2412]|uniref:acyl-CoA dehydrogenase family protein n=1 Tax=Acaryochloris marina TaxID=155978 RepID=UPI004058EDA8
MPTYATLVSMGRLVGRQGQAEQYYRLTAQQNLVWGNALNSRDQRLKLMSVNGAFRLNGVKSFCTGMVAADISIVLSMQEKSNHPVLCVVPMDREGITYNHDWDTMGQRRTASGSYTFHDVLVNPDEVLGPLLSNGASTTLKSLIALLGQTFVYLGIAEGALEAAKEYTTTSARAWMASDAETALQDPFILHRYGQMWAELQAVIALARQAADALQAGWDKETALTSEERGEIAISMASARAMAIQVGLKITTNMFDVMGARATAANHGFDRYWRDLRTFSLHDPIDYKLTDIGNWVLNQQYPTPSQYS